MGSLHSVVRFDRQHQLHSLSIALLFTYRPIAITGSNF